VSGISSRGRVPFSKKGAILPGASTPKPIIRTSSQETSALRVSAMQS
jgi:hypothetical protein